VAKFKQGHGWGRFKLQSSKFKEGSRSNFKESVWSTTLELTSESDLILDPLGIWNSRLEGAYGNRERSAGILPVPFRPPAVASVLTGGPPALLSRFPKVPLRTSTPPGFEVEAGKNFPPRRGAPNELGFAQWLLNLRPRHGFAMRHSIMDEDLDHSWTLTDAGKRSPGGSPV
jgi:hypothetical protein